jgi:hypothetical protein
VCGRLARISHRRERQRTCRRCWDRTHEALDRLEQTSALAYLRERLVGLGVLPERDQRLTVLARVVGVFGSDVPGPDGHALRQYGPWNALRRAQLSAAACLVLLFGQPLKRIARLTTESVRVDRGGVWLRLGPASPRAPVVGSARHRLHRLGLVDVLAARNTARATLATAVPAAILAEKLGLSIMPWSAGPRPWRGSEVSI